MQYILCSIFPGCGDCNGRVRLQRATPELTWNGGRAGEAGSEALDADGNSSYRPSHLARELLAEEVSGLCDLGSRRIVFWAELGRN